MGFISVYGVAKKIQRIHKYIKDIKQSLENDDKSQMK